MNYPLVVMNRAKTYAEIINDFDYGSFRYEYERNNERQITFTAEKTTGSGDIFDMLVNEAYIKWLGQTYVIKSTAITHDNAKISNEVIAKHIFMDFQDHYVDQDISKQTLNDETSSDDNAPLYTLDEYLKFGFKNNKQGFEYEIVGDFPTPVPIAELGNKNGMEYITEGVELFNYIYYADNKKIYFYSEDAFYQRIEEILVYRYNIQGVSVNVNTTDMKTYVKGYGKKKTAEETKNYQPMKPKDFKLSGSFNKDGTWYSESSGASYTKKFTCKWGNETLTWTNKQLSRGGMVDVYLDNKKIGSYSQYSKRSKMNQIVIKKSLAKGSHTFKVVYKGAKSGVDYKKKTPRFYIGTEKTTVLNLTAELKGEDVYHVVDEYKAKNYDSFPDKIAPTVFDETAKTISQLRPKLKESINSDPTVEVTTEYLGRDPMDYERITYDTVNDNTQIRFVHQPLNFNTDLKVAKITKYHPHTNLSTEVEFSNSKKDIVKIQNQINQRIKRVNNTIANGSWTIDKNVQYDFMSNVVGSVLVDE